MQRENGLMCHVLFYKQEANTKDRGWRKENPDERMRPRQLLSSHIKGDQKAGDAHRKRQCARKVDSAELPLFWPNSMAGQDLLWTLELPSDQKNGDECEWALDEKRPGKWSVFRCNLPQRLDNLTISNRSYHSNSHQLGHRYFFLLSLQHSQRFSMLRRRVEEPYLYRTWAIPG